MKLLLLELLELLLYIFIVQKKNVQNNWKLFHVYIFCRYKDYRDANLDLTMQYWHVLAAKLAFVICFEVRFRTHICIFGDKRVYLPLCKVVNTTFTSNAMIYIPRFYFCIFSKKVVRKLQMFNWLK